MIKILLWLLVVTSTCYAQTYPMCPIIHKEMPLHEIRNMLHQEARTLNMPVINKVLRTIKCARVYHVKNNNILTIIDYSLPSNQKRLWVFDLNAKKLLFNTYVSHGIKSGDLMTDAFSNKYNSKASSIGLYKTEKTYYGRDGLSLKLSGLDRGFNDNAENRSVVMHGGWYVEEDFIKKYGRAGRSWGCPALPLQLAKPIINTIKDSALMMIYYPSDQWILKSKFLTCGSFSPIEESVQLVSNVQNLRADAELRDEILFADFNKNQKYAESKPVLVVSADSYARIFDEKPPLERMLRRQANHIEYIALSHEEFNRIVTRHDKDDLASIYFVTPALKMVRGYYETQMNIVSLGKIKEARLGDSGYVIDFESRSPVQVVPTKQFIRWVGL